MRCILRPTVLLFGVLVLGLVSSPGHAQVLGPFTVQLAPFCNVITFTVAAQGPVFNVAGFDDNCGGANRLAASGSLFFNPSGTVGGGLSLIGVAQAASQVALTIDPSGPSGTWTDNTGSSGTLVFGVGTGAGSPRPIGLVLAGGCSPDAVPIAGACIDKYEASVWQTTNAGLIQKIRLGTATLGDLAAGGAVQRGATSDDYGAGCPVTGNGCVDFYAVSIAGVTPSRFVTWFQATAAARNAGKRLPTNAEWQAAALGTPEGSPCLVGVAGLGLTGTAGCVSDVGAFDMVGNLFEWVADWVPLSTTCVPPLFGTVAFNCLAGASTTAGPGALLRGGFFGNAANPGGVFRIEGRNPPSLVDLAVGFRAAR